MDENGRRSQLNRFAYSRGAKATGRCLAAAQNCLVDELQTGGAMKSLDAIAVLAQQTDAVEESP